MVNISTRSETHDDTMAGMQREVKEKLKKGLSKLLQDVFLTVQIANQALRTQ